MDRLSLLVRAKISIHASAKEATSLHMLIHLSYLDFNPRLREGGDALRNSITHQTDLISIHASAKEATTVSSFSGVTEYFNPRLREGGDKEYHRNNGGKKNFNPRLREGGDRNIELSISNNNISIHASAKEATNITLSCYLYP